MFFFYWFDTECRENIPDRGSEDLATAYQTSCFRCLRSRVGAIRAVSCRGRMSAMSRGRGFFRPCLALGHAPVCVIHGQIVGLTAAYQSLDIYTRHVRVRIPKRTRIPVHEDLDRGSLRNLDHKFSLCSLLAYRQRSYLYRCL